MPPITPSGIDLAMRILPSLDHTLPKGLRRLQERCSHIVHLADEHNRIAASIIGDDDKLGVFRLGQVERRIAALCESLPKGIVPVFNRDPNGCAVILKMPDGRSDDMSNTGICVTTQEQEKHNGC